MGNELAITLPTTAMANAASELPALQAPLAGWAREKMETARAEFEELEQAVTEAKKHKWKTSTLAKARIGALARFTFYDKCVKALEAGYMLFPPVPNADVIAIRCSSTCGPYEGRSTSGWKPALEEVSAAGSPAGEGEYKNPFMGWVKCWPYKGSEDSEGKQRTDQGWHTVQELKNAEFPLIMAKPQIIAATNAAMEMKVFDEIRLFPFVKRRGDPCILGVVYDPRNSKRHYFLISWRIDKADI